VLVLGVYDRQVKCWLDSSIFCGTGETTLAGLELPSHPSPATSAAPMMALPPNTAIPLVYTICTPIPCCSLNNPQNSSWRHGVDRVLLMPQPRPNSHRSWTIYCKRYVTFAYLFLVCEGVHSVQFLAVLLYEGQNGAPGYREQSVCNHMS